MRATTCKERPEAPKVALLSYRQGSQPDNPKRPAILDAQLPLIECTGGSSQARPAPPAPSGPARNPRWPPHHIMTLSTGCYVDTAARHQENFKLTEAAGTAGLCFPSERSLTTKPAWPHFKLGQAGPIRDPS